jgi:preprotein translocase SecF subunit
VFDLIGKRRYAYVASGVVTVVSLAFILLTLIPGANLGLRFSIAYTGGTVWEVHFEGDTPSPAEVREILEEQGLPGSEVAITGADGRDYVLIRTEALTLIEPQAAPAPSPAASPDPAASPHPAASPDPAVSPDPAAASVVSSPAASPAGDASVTPVAPAASPPDGDGSATTSALARLDAALSPTAAPAPSPAATSGASPDASPAVAAGAAVTDALARLDAALSARAAGETAVSGVPTEGRFGELAAVLQERFGRIDEVRQQNSVGPVVSNELIQQTLLLILFASLAIMIWISYRFRDLRMGVTAIVALLHDVIVTVGVFALLGTFIDLQIDALFVTAMLTVIGFSVHDTIVVFDRVRENRQRYLGEPLEEIVAFSLMQTVGRSITTSLTIVVTLIALFLLGSEAIRSFTLTMLIGIVIGAYSSIFVATPLFVDWYLRDERRKDLRPAQPSTA